jgi:hypothetical protein
MGRNYYEKNARYSKECDVFGKERLKMGMANKPETMAFQINFRYERT